MESTRTLKPIFENKKHGPGGGFALLKQYGEQFDLSLLYMNRVKHSGVPARQLLFIYVCGLVSGSASVNQIGLLVQKANLFVGKKNEFLAVPIPDVYMKMPKNTTGKNGKPYTRHVFTPIAAIAICRLPEDVEDRRACVPGGAPARPVSNRHDDPMGATAAYVKRWRIEVFYRAAKEKRESSSSLTQPAICFQGSFCDYGPILFNGCPGPTVIYYLLLHKSWR